MKIFAIFAAVELDADSQWVIRYRAQLNDPYELHVTLAQPAFLDELDFPAVKALVQQRLACFTVPGGVIALAFTEPMLHKPTDQEEGYIMLRAEASALNELQRVLIADLAAYRNYTEPESAEYETIFEPHLTLARKLTTETYGQALASLPTSPQAYATCREIVLVSIPAETPEAPLAPQDRIAFPLQATKEDTSS